MENNDSNLKPQSVGGLKLMTVFVVVLALHVVVIGSICTYYLLKGGNSDADVLAGKIQKSMTPSSDAMMSSDSTTPDTGDKTTPAPASPADTAGTNPTSGDNTIVMNDAGSIINPPATPTASTDTPSTPASTPVAATSPDASATSPIASVTPVPGPATPSASVPPAINNLAPPPDVTPAANSTPAPAPTAAMASTAGTPYVVKQGDVLEKIAHRNHVSVAKLKAANNLSSDFLHIGQKLTIPAATPDTAAATTTAPLVVAGKTGTASSTNATEPKAKTASNFTQKKNKTAVASVTTPSKPGYYTVQKGDNLTKIAHKFKTTPTAIMTANNLSDPKKLSIGEKLKIPSREARSAKSVEPSDKPVQGEATTAPTVAPATQLANVTQ